MMPTLAKDFVEGKLNFPLGAQPKIDGVRGLNMLGALTGRSLKHHKNRFTTKLYSHSSLIGMDGELAAAHECDPDLCRKTSSAVGTIEGEPYTLWWLFDYVTPETIRFPYAKRFEMLQDKVRNLYHTHNGIWQHLRVVPMTFCHSIEELLAFENKCLLEGYEGVCIRNLTALHKEGRSTIKNAELLRIKRFIESEAIVKSIEEGSTNINEAQINELGKQFRSSHQDGKVPNEMVGSMQATACETITDAHTGKIVIEEGQIITIAPGNMTEDMALDFFKNPHKLLEQRVKFKFFPKGIKDKPRFATFQSLRIDSDT